MFNRESPTGLETDAPLEPGSLDDATAEPVTNGAYGWSGSHRGLTDIDPWAYVDPRAAARERRRRFLRGATEVLEVVALALIMFMGVRMVVHNYVVDGESMVPTFENGQLVIVNRLAYTSLNLSWVPGVENDDWRPFGDPDPGDVIVFTHDPDTDRSRDFIKRVIGAPGDIVAVQDGLVYVNGEALEEPYISEPPNGNFGPEEVPPEHVFVMGDNRNNSFDSRIFGMVSRDQVIGRAEVRYWPLREATLIDHHIGTPVLGLPAVTLPTVTLPSVTLPSVKLEVLPSLIPSLIPR